MKKEHKTQTLSSRFSDKWQEIVRLLTVYTNSEQVSFCQIIDNKCIVLAEYNTATAKQSKRTTYNKSESFESLLSVNPRMQYIGSEQIKQHDLKNELVSGYNACLMHTILSDEKELFGALSIRFETEQDITKDTRSLVKQFADMLAQDILNVDITAPILPELEKQAARHAQLRFREFFNQDKTIKLLIDPRKQKIAEANKAAAEFYGYKSHELKGMPVSEINTLPTETIKEKISQLNRLEVNHNEFRHKLKSGEVKDVEIYSTPIIIENQLLESEEKYRQIIETTSAGFWIINQSGYIIDANPAYCRMSGYSREELLKLHISDVDNLEKEEDTKRRIKSIVKNGYATFETVHRKKDGSLYEVIVNTSFLNTKKSSLIAFLTDISDRKQAERALQESEKKYRDLFEVNSDAIFISRFNTSKKIYKVVDLNSTTSKLLGYSKNEVLQKSPVTFEVSQPKEVHKHRIKQLKSVGYCNFETSIIHKSGKIINVDVKSNMITYKDKPAIMNIMRDITERKRIEMILRRNKQQLSELNRAKDRFFSIIAHDLRSPFNAIIGFSELIFDNVRDNNLESIKENSKIIKEAAQETFDLLNNLLQWSRMQTGKIKFNPELSKLKPYIDKILSFLHVNIKAKKLKLIVEVADNISVNADESMLKIIIRNLVSNAVKFSYPEGEIRIVAYENSNGTVFKVSDEGVGISSDFQDKLFRIDAQVSRPGTQNEQGSGLGLLLCKEFINKHNGNIQVESEPKKGSTFTVFLTNPHK